MIGRPCAARHLTCLLLLGVMTVISTLISDIVLVWIDPRIRLEET